MKKKYLARFVLALLAAAILLAPGCTAGYAAQPVNVSAASGSTSVQYYFPRAGQAPAPVLMGIINNAKTSLDVAIYSFTDTDIADALIAAHRRGVEVRVISDRESSSNSSQKRLLLSLARAGIAVKINTHQDLMHMKVTIADKTVVTTGSFNYTKTAENYNDEVFVVIHSAQAGQDFSNEFASMWNDSGNFTEF